MRAAKLNNDPRLLAACAIDKDRCMKVRVGVSKGRVQIDLRAFLEVGRRAVKTAAGLYFPIGYLPRVIATLQRADAMIKQWDLEEDA